jgi:hypothetical protein
MDHDQLFKDLLTTFFVEFLELFFPKMAAELDRESIQFLDKELSTDLGAGEKLEVDLLVKVQLRGKETFILIHVENQASAQADFPKRMFRYFSLLHLKHDLPIYPIAIFSYDRPLTPAVDVFALELFELAILRFQFQAIQLNRLSWRDYLSKPNPVASALMTKMNFTTAERPRVKLECLRMMLTLKYDPARTELISKFMKSYLGLTHAEQVVYNNEIQTIDPQEQELVMVYMNEWEERGFERGITQGRTEALTGAVVRQLHRRFGELPTDLVQSIGQLSADESNALIEALLDFTSLADAHVWLANHTQARTAK